MELEDSLLEWCVAESEQENSLSVLGLGLVRAQTRD